ncbi:MAG: DNA translocase FtsK, partial [Chloroflexota bacterium]
MATRRRRRRKQAWTWPEWNIPPEVARSLVGITLLVFGAVTLIMVFLPAEQGTLTDWARQTVIPFFGAARFLLPFVLIVAGAYVELSGRVSEGWQLRIVAAACSYVALLGVLEYVPLVKGGGRIGTFLADVLGSLITRPGALVVLIGLMLAFAALALERPLRVLVEPFFRPVRGISSILERGAPDDEEEDDEEEPVRREPALGRAGGVLRSIRVAAGEAVGQTGLWGRDRDAETEAAPFPTAMPSTGPTSATFAPARAGGAGTATLERVRVRQLEEEEEEEVDEEDEEEDEDDVTDASDSPETVDEIEYVLPPFELLDDIPIPTEPGGAEIHHQRNEEIIVRKLAGFNIPAVIIARNAGPVVTQYEVQPAPDIKVSRIEALADDLAMALAARSLRIEAPIPGKSAVGIEIPNKEFNIVALRRILEEVDIEAAGSKLTFALGRDVSGKAQAVDLAKMPHLLIAGATGSGKSVMVNALITSLLCEATPDDVRMILMDLKRVELASYNGLPHLLVPVITEPERAKAALKWAVNEMEGRYRRFAGAAARNIKGYNESRADPADMLPYIVIIIDELADLMMREGKNVEDPIVRLAQKARATGIHMVLATQRPSVNVVTGLIKANFPSRIAFAMASQIDSR